MRNYRLAIEINENNSELIKFLNHGHIPFHREGEDQYFTVTINRSGYVGNRLVRKFAWLFERNKYDENVPFAVVNSQP